MTQSEPGQTRRLVLGASAVGIAVVVFVAARHPAGGPPRPPQARDEVMAAATTRRSARPGPPGAAPAVAARLTPEVAALRRELDELEVPESSACAVARDSQRAETDPRFAQDVETICVAWRKAMWTYASAHAAEVEAGDPEAIDRVRNTIAALDMGLMRELLAAGGADDPSLPAVDDHAADDDPAPAPPERAPTLGPEAVETNPADPHAPHAPVEIKETP